MVIKFSKIVSAFLSLIVLCGCQPSSMIVLENPEFPDALRPQELGSDLLKKYGAGEVIIHPRITHADAAQTTYQFFIVFFSKSKIPVVSIKTIALSINGVKVEYGTKMINGVPSDWRRSSVNEAYYVSHIYAEPIDRPEEEMVKARVDVSLEVSVKDESGKVTEKTIEVYFLPKKRLFLFNN